MRRPRRGRSGRPASRSRDGRCDLAAQPVPRAVRAGAGGAGHVAGETPPTRSRSRRSTRPGSSARLETDRGRDGAPRGRGRRDAAPPAGEPSAPPRPRSASSTRPRSTTTARTAATRRSTRALEIGPGGASSPRSPRRSSIGPRRRGLPDRPQVGRRRRPARPAALPRLQRRRVGAGHVQGPRPARGRPVRRRRGDDDRGLRDRRVEGLPLHPRRVPARPRRASPTRSTRRATAGLLGAGHPRLGLRLRHRAPARRRRLHLRRGDGALRVDRGQARRAAQQAAVPGRGRAVRQADRRQQRRDAGQRAAASCSTAARRSPAIGTEGSTGPKLFCLSGHVARPGVYEVEFGATLRDLIELAGGVPGGRAIRTILLGGAAGVFVGPDALDMPLTFEATRAVGATLGSGVVMVFDETADLVDTLRRIAQFFRDESCGQCVPCRVGTRPPGGAARPARRRLAGPAARRGAGAPARDRPGDARRVDLRPRPDGVVGDRVRAPPAGSGGAVTDGLSMDRDPAPDARTPHAGEAPAPSR